MVVPSAYRLSRPVAARLTGVLLVAVGVLVVVVTLLVALAGLPTWVLTAGVLGASAVVLVAAVVLTRRVVVVRLDEVGYQVRFVRGVGVARARWTDVEDAVASTIAGERCVVLRLRDGRTSTIPVRMLAGDADAFVHDLQAHLDKGHGYRRLT